VIIKKSKKELLKLEKEKKVMFIALWNDITSASKFYYNYKNLFYYIDKNPKHAKATPVRIYKCISN
jgi:hypothetical protein